ncbi:HNH endonuclease [Variovorax ureilyticus]|uniref:HNH endonuclease n=1 Tax=Variovorax ureilyticus TaxID=1836198 RepID=A0ABU8VCL4_9BURK
MKSRLQKHRTSAIRQQHGRCIYCERPMGQHATAEHLHPRQDGGTDCRENIAAACRRCNHRRHAEPVCASLHFLDYYTLVLIEKSAGILPRIPMGRGAT